MSRLRAPAGRHVGSKTLPPQNKAPEESYPVGRHSAAVLAGVYSGSSVGYYRRVALPGTAPLGLEEYERVSARHHSPAARAKVC